MKLPAFLGRIGLPVVAVLCLDAALAAQQPGLSHVRVVRLSYVSGTVAIIRAGSTEWAKAMVNTPIQEGFGLSTSENSYAEAKQIAQQLAWEAAMTV